MDRIAPSTATIVERVLAVFPAAKRVLLFGSRARDTAASDSDFDLLVVVDTVLPPPQRSARLRLALRDLKGSFDLVVVTPQEYDRLVDWKSTVVHQAAVEGRVLHEAA